MSSNWRQWWNIPNSKGSWLQNCIWKMKPMMAARIGRFDDADTLELLKPNHFRSSKKSNWMENLNLNDWCTNTIFKQICDKLRWCRHLVFLNGFQINSDITSIVFTVSKNEYITVFKVQFENLPSFVMNGRVKLLHALCTLRYCYSLLVICIGQSL